MDFSGVDTLRPALRPFAARYPYSCFVCTTVHDFKLGRDDKDHDHDHTADVKPGRAKRR